MKKYDINYEIIGQSCGCIAVIRPNTWKARTAEKLHLYDDISLGGWGNGYVLLPKEHPAFGIDYDCIHIDVHGGLTFSEKSDQITDITEMWAVGFDTGHYGDNEENWTKEDVIVETLRLLKQLTSLNLLELRS